MDTKLIEQLIFRMQTSIERLSDIHNEKRKAEQEFTEERKMSRIKEMCETFKVKSIDVDVDQVSIRFDGTHDYIHLLIQTQCRGCSMCGYDNDYSEPDEEINHRKIILEFDMDDVVGKHIKAIHIRNPTQRGEHQMCVLELPDGTDLRMRYDSTNSGYIASQVHLGVKDENNRYLFTE